MKKLLFITLFLIASPVSAKMLWEYGDFNQRAEMAVSSGVVADISEYQGTYEQNLNLLSIVENKGLIEYENLGASTQPAALTTYNLAGSGVSSSASSITLQSLTIPQNDYPIQDADLSDIFYLTLEPGSRVRQEIASCTTVTQNAGGTATLSGCTRGLSPITPYTASSTLQFSHAGGSQVIFSDAPQLFNLYPAKANSETITGQWTFNTVLPSSSLLATTTNQLTTKEYVDNTTNQGAATSTDSVAGISEQATPEETASSTPFDANNPHHINSEQATSTPTSSCDTVGSGTAGSFCIPVAENDGKLNQSWLDLTEVWEFNTASSSDLQINGTSLTPLSDGSNADSLHTHPRLVNSSTTPATFDAVVGQVALFATSTLPANTLAANRVIRMSVYLSRIDIAGSATTTLTFKYGSSGTLNVNLVNNVGSSLTNQICSVDVELIGVSASSQDARMRVFCGSGLYVDSAADSPIVIGHAQDIFTVDSTTDQPISLLGSNTGNDDRNTRGGYIYLIR